MRWIPLALFILSSGCAPPEMLHAYRPAGALTAVEREDDLQRNVRSDRSWHDQQEKMADVKAAFGTPSTADATGPAGPR